MEGGGGASRFLDSYAAAVTLHTISPSAFSILSRVPITFHYRNNGHHLYFRRSMLSAHPLRVFYAPMFQGTLEVDYADTVEFYKAYAEWESILKKPGMGMELMLKPGECAVFDNRRVLHARTAFDVSTGKERWLKGTYVDVDAFRDHLRVLEVKAEQESWNEVE